ncbi:RHS repeat-associated core domain-containing protein, partial [Cronobacter sakazakii]
VTQRTVLDARRELVFERRYRWDRTDQIVQQIHTDTTPATPGEKYSQYLWGYDAAGQVTKAVGPQKEERFFWDPAGNRTEEHRNPVWHNLLLRLDGLKLDYDGFGRLIQRRDKSGVIQHFAYDDEQRVKEIRFEGNAEFRRVEYRYDPLGRRTHKVLWRYGEKDPETIRFDWQGLQLAGEQSDREPDHYVQYVYTEGSYEPLARVDSVFDDCEIYWYHTELNGLPERVTDADGQTVWRGQFSTWGETERELSVPQWQVPQNLRFQGQYLDRESGLHYNLFRYYDPVDGRYTQMDPIGLAGGLNTYSYVGDPLTWVDPWGLEACKPDSGLARGDNPYQTRVDPRYPERPDPAYSIDTTTFNSGTPTSKGGIRNNKEFWQQWSELQPASLSKNNLYRIQELGLSPKIDDTWIKVFPEHVNYKGDTLIHHHVDFGPYAIPVPGKTHVGSGGVWHTK